MKTFEQFVEFESQCAAHSGYMYGQPTAKEAWNACAAEYDHAMKNKDTAIKLHKEAFEKLKKENEEMRNALKRMSDFMISKDWDDDKDLINIRQRYSLQEESNG